MPEEDTNSTPVPEKEIPEADADKANADASDNDSDSLEQQLEQAVAEAAEHLDNFLRAKAESENIRRRSAEDVIKARKFAVEQLATELLTVRDSLELASQASVDDASSPAVAQMHEGVNLTLKQLDNAFEKAGITAVDPADEIFNPDLHHAISMTETDEVEPNMVVSVMQKGYLLNDRLLRPAMVVVAKAVTTGEKTDEENDGAEPSEP